MEHRRAAGKFYTPAPVVRYIVQQTLDWLRADSDAGCLPRVLEPACGEGIFLLEAFRYLSSTPPGDSRRTGRILRHSLYGMDQDVRAIERTRRALASLVAVDDLQRDRPTTELAQNIRCGNALIDGDPATKLGPLDWTKEFPAVFRKPGDGFDAVIGNPPYVNIRLLSQHHGSEVKRCLRENYRCAVGAYDLYVLFFELALRLLRPGGVCGMIVPNKLATLNYARACRAMLQHETTLLSIADLSGCRVFPDANVYPYVVIWRKQPPPPGHQFDVVQIDRVEDLERAVPIRRVLQRDLQVHGGWHLHGSLDVESRVPTRPLGELADMHSGTTGFQAARVAALLREASADRAEAGFEFVVSGNIGRYTIQTGQVRFMHRRYIRPYLPDDAGEFTAAKRQLYRGAKILVAGMSRRLEAAWDPGGLALGVSLYAVVSKSDPFYLLALLNSKLMSHLFRLRFQAKRLNGGYLAINKGQLASLPIQVASDDDAPVARRQLAAWAETLVRLGTANQHPGGEMDRASCRRWQAIERHIDQKVYQLYSLTSDEVRSIEEQAG